jgi:hypothetical protein
MKPFSAALPFLLVCSGLSAWAGPNGAAVPQRLSAAKAGATAQNPASNGIRVANGDDVRREEAAVGRRLTPQELAELRQQVRQQWATAPEAGRTAELPATGRIAPEPSVKVEGVPAVHTARP